MPDAIKIMLVDDHDLVRQSWKLLFDKDSNFVVIAQCRNGAEAIEQAIELQPDVVLMDVNMTPINGFEATRKITEACSAINIIGVSINNNPKYAKKMLAHGAKGFVTKTSAFAELKTAIQKVHAGENYICQEIQSKLTSEQ